MFSAWKKVFHKLAIFGVILGLIVTHQAVHAESLEEIEKQIADLTNQLQQSQAATTPLEAEVVKLQKQIANIQSQIGDYELRIENYELRIEERDEKIKIQFVVLATKVRDYYKKTRFYSPLMTLLSSQSAGELTRELTYKEATADEDKEAIVAITKEIITLEEDKEKLESDKVRLAGLQKKIDTQKAFFEKEISGAKKWQAELSGKIATLTAKQQAILSARSGSFITGVGSVPIGSDYDASIAGFNENAPVGSFGVFSFGAFTHRKGMSQYGAKARASSQSYEDILQAYYGKKPVNKDTGGDIIVNGSSMNFEERYLMGIAEMPSDWPEQALKAQAVAARTYAYRYKIEGKSICTTEACQVFLSSKADNPPESWRKAVQDTRGQVLEDVVTYYSSTAGGYLSTSGWDTTDKSGGGDWTSRAYESVAGSPWFYKAWYRNGYKNSDNACGRKPWLTEEEMADIINAWLVLKKGEGNGADTGRVLPITIGSCPVGGQSGDPYSISDLRSKTNNPVTSISGKPTVTHDGNGNTTNVRVVTNRGELNIPGSEFKEVFNTRAPGYIAIPQKGFAFFNIERK
jgi:peptidoglycan hydrolase CwlO-like protein